jgi:hypothetical protein
VAVAQAILSKFNINEMPESASISNCRELLEPVFYLAEILLMLAEVEAKILTAGGDESLRAPFKVARQRLEESLQLARSRSGDIPDNLSNYLGVIAAREAICR